MPQDFKSESVILLWHDGIVSRKVSSSAGPVKMIVVNNEESFNTILEICEKHAPMTTKDITPAEFQKGGIYANQIS